MWLYYIYTNETQLHIKDRTIFDETICCCYCFKGIWPNTVFFNVQRLNLILCIACVCSLFMYSTRFYELYIRSTKEKCLITTFRCENIDNVSHNRVLDTRAMTQNTTQFLTDHSIAIQTHTHIHTQNKRKGVYRSTSIDL